eukprot:SAG31_NODE_36461_length_313_cov_0.719626_1_plen_53_part_10
MLNVKVGTASLAPAERAVPIVTVQAADQFATGTIANQRNQTDILSVVGTESVR